jgi:hypothetical protein
VRRSLLVAGGVLAVPIVAVGGVYGWAWSATDESTFARAVIWREADVGDQNRFPARRIRAGRRASPLLAAADADLVVRRGTGFRRVPARNGHARIRRRPQGPARKGALLRRLGSRALLTSFSVAKSFVSILVGIAMDEGLIRSVDDPVTDYVPELAARDPRFRQITLRHLLTMSSGIRYREDGFPSLGDDTCTYYGVDLRDVGLNRTRIEQPPGSRGSTTTTTPC